ncbi:hypothetical protein GCM10023340_15510 [Nocardioides marinquilinus]|uniref:Uncharacterized protein n=1 Tax=Nocardioides marinquilinus TaxID=1210400 RepID=A0ABP9PFC9_9ACTN
MAICSDLGTLAVAVRSKHVGPPVGRDPLDFPRTPTRLSFPRGTNVCGYGNAHVLRAVDDDTTDSWRIFWNGRWPAEKDGFHLYAGRVSWRGGKPVVAEVYPPR